jgi:hypothetical protein
MAVTLSDSRTGRVLIPRYFLNLFVVLILATAWVTQGLVRSGRLGKLMTCNYLVGCGTHELPDCSTAWTTIRERNTTNGMRDTPQRSAVGDRRATYWAHLLMAKWAEACSETSDLYNWRFSQENKEWIKLPYRWEWTRWSRTLKWHLETLSMSASGRRFLIPNGAPSHVDTRGYGGVAPPPSASTLDGDEWTVSRSGCCTPENHNCTHLTVWRAGPSGLEVV